MASPLEKSTAANEIMVTYFISPSCQICQFYTLTMRKIHEEYSQKGVRFHGVISGRQFDNEDAERFIRKYKIPFEVTCDTALHYQMNATVTPEVFVTNPSNEVQYYGRIDDSYVAIGKRKTKSTTNELRTVLEALLNGDTAHVKHVQAVGCIIEK